MELVIQILLWNPSEKTIFIYPNRIEEIKKQFVEYGFLTEYHLTLPMYIGLFNEWDEYINSAYESVTAYSNLKDNFIKLFNEKIFFEWLNDSRFFHRTSYMLERLLPDITEY